jgi:hypothetical protein
MKILFLHGWSSVVGGVKPSYLQQQGHEVINPKLDDDDFERALRTAQKAFDAERPDVVVGSSRGGAVAMNLANDGIPLVLLCPAWKKWGGATSVQSRSMVLHARNDEIIAFQDSVELVRNSGKERAVLLEVGHDHRLADPESLATMEWACKILPGALVLPWSDDESGWEEPQRGTSQEEGSYICDACGEEIVIPLDVAEGSHQQYVEDCPVCCRANIIHVDLDAQGNPNVWSEPEQDHDG